MSARNGETPDRLLTVADVAGILHTAERFPRLLIAERRIEFVRIGRHVRIRESALADFMRISTIAPSAPTVTPKGRPDTARGRSRQFGNIRKLPSGRYQARYRGSNGKLRPAPVTFERKTDAGRWLSLKETEIARGELN